MNQHILRNSDPFFEATLAERDPEIYDAVRKELGRQQHEIELIASDRKSVV